MAKRSYPFVRPKPWPHQIKAIKKLVANNGGGLWMPLRSGKTRVAIDFAGYLYLTGRIDRVLVIGPRRARPVWRHQIEKYEPDEVQLKWHITTYGRTYERETEGDFRGAAKGVNRRLVQFVVGGRTLVVVDEAHRIGDPSTVQSKMTYAISRKAVSRLALTGTPWHRRPFKIFGQFRFIDESVFGSDYNAFRRQYGVFGGYGGYKLLQYINLKLMRKKVRPRVFLMKEVPKREPVHVTHEVELEPRAKRLYDRVVSDAIASLENGETVTADMVLTRLIRQCQIVDGWVKADNGELQHVSTAKRDSFYEWLDDAYESELKKLVVICRWLPGLRDAARVAQTIGYKPLLMHGKVSEKEAERRMAEFDESKEPCAWIGQVQSMSEAIDLSAADVTVHYSLTNSLLDFDQSSGRMRRFKDERPLTYVYFLSEIEKLVLTSLKEGRDVVNILTQHPDWLRRG